MNPTLNTTEKELIVRDCKEVTGQIKEVEERNTSFCSVFQLLHLIVTRESLIRKIKR